SNCDGFAVVRHAGDEPFRPRWPRSGARLAGQCWDNAGAESLWSTFKHEHYYRHSYVHKAELVAAVDNWMVYYNSTRRHSTIGMLSPIDYEVSLTADLRAA
ncbi:integrase-like protein, partial [Rhodococcus sp. SMB37]|uniref:integrase core domain-containing protein n=1 Tax=Rhodococcus sp. SMB37 TaxID=2512213 RepID=UPI0010D5D09C